MSSAYREEESSIGRNQEFKAAADQICQIAGRYGVSIKGYHSPELPLFAALPLASQLKTLLHIRTYVRTLEMIEANGGGLDNDDRALWQAMGALGLVPPSRLFSLLQGDDVIEVYDLEGIQIWRNLNCMRVCSYTLEEIYAIEWPVRYQRDQEKNSECLEKVGHLLAGRTEEVFAAAIGPHILEETNSADRYILEVRHDYLARLNDGAGNTAAWLVTSKAEILGRAELPMPARTPLRIVAEAPTPTA